jgi:hypothetical protein
MKRFVLLCAALFTLAGALPAAAAPLGSTDAVELAGHVTSADSGDPVAGVCVSTRNVGAGETWWNEGACTNADGDFVFQREPSRYEIQYDPADDLGLQWWPHVDSPADAVAVVVRKGKPVTDLDAQLFEAATMTGRAIDGATGDLLDGGCIDITTTESRDSIAHVRDAGAWSIGGLPPGELTVLVSRCDRPWRLTWAYDALHVEDAAVFDLEPGKTTKVGDVALVEGATVKGRVITRKSHEVPDWAEAALNYSPGGRSGEGPLYGALANAKGHFVIRDIQPGDYTPVGYATHEYAPQWAGRATSWADGRMYHLEPGAVAQARFRLDRSSTIEGRFVGDQDGIMVDAFSDEFTDVGNIAAVGYSIDVDPNTGRFSISGLPAHDVYLSFDAAYYDPDRGFWFDGAEDIEHATLVHLRRGKTTKVTAHFPPSPGRP